MATRPWGWDRIGDFRGYAVGRNLPLAGVYRSRRQGEATNAELDLLPSLAPGSRLVDLMPWGGTIRSSCDAASGRRSRCTSASCPRTTTPSSPSACARKDCPDANMHFDLIKGGRLPYADGSMDAVFAAQALEHTPEPGASSTRSRACSSRAATRSLR